MNSAQKKKSGPPSSKQLSGSGKNTDSGAQQTTVRLFALPVPGSMALGLSFLALKWGEELAGMVIVTRTVLHTWATLIAWQLRIYIDCQDVLRVSHDNAEDHVCQSPQQASRVPPSCRDLISPWQNQEKGFVFF